MTNYNISPYYDDFDEDKKFLRVLFKAGHTVQARELTQAQTILENQIERFGNHIFADGAMVIPGGFRYHRNVTTLGIDLSVQYSLISGQTNLIIRTNTTGIDASIVHTQDVIGSGDITLFVEELNSGTNKATTLPSVSETFSVFSVAEGTGVETLVATGTVNSVDSGSWCEVDSGIYYIKGHFVLVSEDKLAVDIAGIDPSFRIGFQVSEEIITSDDDSSLKSAALGYPNHLSEGADRIKISTTLSKLALTDTADDGFVEIARVVDGNLIKKVEATEYSIIADTLAQRTFEESGDYSVKPFGIDIREHLNDGSNNGRYLVGDGGDEAKIAFGVTPGIGYVKGYRVQNLATQYVNLDKGREVDFSNNSATAAQFGNYVVVSGLHSMPPTDITKLIDLHDAAIVGGASAGSVIGTAKVRSVSFEASDKIRMHLIDVQMNAGKTFGDVQGVRYTDASSLFGGTVTVGSLNETGKSIGLFALPHDAVKTLKQGGTPDTTYTVMRQFVGTPDGAGDITFNVGANELFDAIDSTKYFLAATGVANPGTVVNITTSNSTLGGAPTGSNITIQTGLIGTDVILHAPVIKQVPVERTKTLLNSVEPITISSNKVSLGFADVFRINSITNTATSEDITGQFKLDNGQRDNFYDVGSIETIDGSVVSANISVDYDYFSHGAGDYCSVDSYGGIDRGDIPSYTSAQGRTYSLANCIDFRRVKNSSGIFIGSGEMVRANTSIRADVEFYLPRIDIVYVDVNANFGVTKGVSSLDPDIPTTKRNAMALYTVMVPAYTFAIEDLVVRKVENKRYTMRDIGRLEKRIANLEYYTSLSQIEQSAANINVIDPVTGTPRFKNGFAGDGFTDFKLSDTDSVEWAGAIDNIAGRFRPSFIENAVDYSDGVLTNMVKTPGGLYMLSYVEKDSIVQPYATETINVNPFAVFTWNSTVVLEPSSDFWRDVKYVEPTIINRTENTRGAAQEGTVWNTWSTSDRDRAFRGNWGIETTTTSFRQSTTTRFTDITTNQVVSEERITSEIIPWMREIDVDFNAEGLKPFTTVYPFFAGQAVSANTKPQGGALGDSLVTDENGTLLGTFTIPNTASLRFPTGEAVFRLTDSDTDDRASNSTQGQAVFTSTGIVDINRQNIISTRNLGLEIIRGELQSEVTQRRFEADQQNDDGGGGGGDPLAQTFLVSTAGGEFITSVDLFFSTKSTQNIPVFIQIREVENGVPTSRVLPFGEVFVNPDNVNVSADASLATTFTFSSPLFLREGVEYAIVVLANTQEYNCWISKIGGQVVNSREFVSKQPHLGSLLISQNSSTWTPEQEKDLMFTLKRAQFVTNTTGTAVFSCNDVAALPLETNPVRTTNTSSTVRIVMKGHGLKVGDSVTIAGSTGGNGIDSGEINGSRTVTAVDAKGFEFTSPGTATATGAIGGSVATAKANYPISLMHHNIESLDFNSTTLSHQFQMKSQSTRGFLTAENFVEKTNLIPDEEGVVLTTGDMKITSTMSTLVDNLSPVVDSERLMSLLVYNLINNDTTDEDLTNKGAAVCRQVSREISFDNPNTSATLLVGAYLPGSTNITAYYKLIKDDTNLSTVDWSEVTATTSIVNDDLNFNEYTYNVDNVGSFSGIKFKLVLTGEDSINVPQLSDFRVIALA